MPFCPTCGKPVGESDIFCNSCGSKLNPVSNNDSNLIPPTPVSDLNNPPLLPIQNPLPKTTEKKQTTYSNDNQSSTKTKKPLPLIINTQRTPARVGMFLTLLGILGIFLPNVLEMNMLDGGGALIFGGIFVTIIGLVVWIVYHKRANTFDKVVAEKELLAHWHYGGEIWKLYTEEEYKERKSNNMTTLGIIIFFMMLACVGLVVFGDDTDAAWLVVGFLGDFTVILAIIAVLAYWIPYQRRKQLQEGEVLISPYGLWIAGDFHEWIGWGMRLDEVLYDADAALLTISFSAPTRGGRVSTSLPLPVPEGEETTAIQIIEYFKNKHT